MKIPDGYTEAKVVEIMYSIAYRLAPTFRFGYNEIEDMVQEAVMEAIKAMEDYDVSKGTINNFIWTHMHNRLYNLKRDKYERPDKPCLNCPLAAYDPHCRKSNDQCTAFVKKDECELYNKWHVRNSRKKNLVSPIAVDILDDNHISFQEDQRIVDRVYGAQIIGYVDENVPMEFRSSWIRLKNGINLKKDEREKLLTKVREILEKAGFNYGG